MDDKEKDALASGAGLATLGGIIAGPPGVVVGGLAGAIIGGSETAHNEALRDAAYTIKDAADEHGTLYVDHIEPDGSEAGGTRKVLQELSMDPDLIFNSPVGYSNLIIEVETMDAIKNNPGHVLEQLDDFRVQGFRRVLVAPDDEIDDVSGWVEAMRRDDEIAGTLNIAGPTDVGELI